MTPKLARLEELARKATPKWQAYERNRGLIAHEWEIRTPSNGILFRSTSYGNMNHDAEFIGAASPEVVLELIEKLRIAKEALGYIAMPDDEDDMPDQRRFDRSEAQKALKEMGEM